MSSTGGYVVSQHVVASRTIAAVRGRVAAGAVSRVFRQYLDQVYAAARTGAVHLDGQNVFVYRDAPDRAHEMDVDFGVGITAPFQSVGRVEPSLLPTGDVAMTTHWGSYARLGDAHNAVIAWCDANGHERAGPRWEVYGHWTDDESRLRTDVFYLLTPTEPHAR